MVASTLLSAQLVHASCVTAYEDKVAEIQNRQKLRNWITIPSGLAAGFGAAVLVTYDFSILPLMGAAALGFGAEEIARIREGRFAHLAAVIKDSYAAQSTEDLREETWRLSKKMKEQLTLEELASVIAKLDASDAFCPEGKPLRMRAFRNLVRDTINPLKVLDD